MELHDELYFFRRIPACDHGSDPNWMCSEPARPKRVTLMFRLGDCIDLDNNPQNPKIEARRYHIFIVGNEWTHAAVPDATMTLELSVTVGTDWEKPFTQECFRNHHNFAQERSAQRTLPPFCLLPGRRKHELEQNRTETPLHTLPCAW